jgi:hypothetical protein
MVPTRLLSAWKGSMMLQRRLAGKGVLDID